MAGVRLRHPTLHGVLYLVVHPGRRYPAPYLCPTCSKPDEAVLHENKTYHLRLDELGCVIVSPEIWARLQELRGAGLSYAGDVADPPAQTISLAGMPPLRIEEHIIRREAH